MRAFVSLFQAASGAWHLPSILAVAGWLVGSAVTGVFLFANLRVNRDDRIRAFHKEQQSIGEATQARARIEELERQQHPRSITLEQTAIFIDATKAGPFGPVVLATHAALPTKEQLEFTMQLRAMLDEAGFGAVEQSAIVHGFGTSADARQLLTFVSRGNAPPLYFSNLASALYKVGLISRDVPILINNPNVKEGALYLFIPEK